METLRLSDILYEKSYPEAGVALFPHIEAAIKGKDKLCIDMDGVDSIPTLFMNTSFGEVIRIYGATTFKKVISFTHIQKSQAERIKKYIADYEFVLERNKTS